jgi:hypothetical protein
VFARRLQHGQREGIELSAAFTATVNAELRVGALEETISVAGQSPMVDTQNVVQQKVIRRDFLESLPNSRSNDAALTPGVDRRPLQRVQRAATARSERALRNVVAHADFDAHWTSGESRREGGVLKACAGAVPTE